MPLRCLSDNADILAFEVSPEEWEDLRKENSQNHHLRMPCCDSRVVLKTSRLGTQFFSHARKGECSSAPETPEHLLAKSIVAGAAKRAGWSVTTEYRGTTPEGEAWVADVYVTKGNAKIALEIQWSPQNEETTRYRQERYRKSGVRALWLMRQPNILIEEATPTFHLALNEETKTFVVRLPNPANYRQEYLTSKNKGDPYYWSQSLPLEVFIQGALSKRMGFNGKDIPASVYGAHENCWKCGRKTLLVSSIELEISKIMPTSSNIKASLGFFYDNEGTRALCDQILKSDILRKHGIGEIRLRYSKTEKKEYHSNGCFHCGALSGRFFERDLYKKEKLIYSESVIFDEVLATRFGRNDLINSMGWYFKEGS
jgi:hypothetical protein